ncbi:hypothetical protein PSAB6_50244 [Paraburkholderia sabiae]|nr:hypothetical protein PSAB6_50244 [Paraburkholderia sabiae]
MEDVLSSFKPWTIVIEWPEFAIGIDYFLAAQGELRIRALKSRRMKWESS